MTDAQETLLRSVQADGDVRGLAPMDIDDALILLKLGENNVCCASEEMHGVT